MSAGFGDLLMISRDDNLNTDGIGELLADAFLQKLKEIQNRPLINKKEATKCISSFRLKKRDIEWILSILQQKGQVSVSKKGIELIDGIENLVEKQTR